MSWLNRLMPHGKEIAQAQKASQQEIEAADKEVSKAKVIKKSSARLAAEVSQINYNNGFSVALGHAFAKKGIT